MNEKFFGSLVKDGTSQNLFASCGSDELLLQERLDDAGGVDPANLLNLRNRNRLPVRDNGKGLERGQ